MEERKARILIYDIETSPIIGYTWGVWQTDVIEILQDWQILSVAWKWYGEKRVHCIGQDDFKNYKPGKLDDYEVVKVLHELFDEADIVVAHNGNAFDQKKVQARMMIHHMAPPSPYKQIDTKMVAKRYAGFTRNNLKHLATDLNVARKGDPGGFETWQGCLAGDARSWRRMKKYNKQDIPPLEDLYTMFRPWITNHPNLARITNRPEVCPKCGSDAGWESAGWRTTNVSRFRRYRCKACGGYASQRQAADKTEDVKPSYVNIPS